MVEGLNYTLGVSGLPTSDDVTDASTSDLVVSVASSAATKGGLAHSYASHLNAVLPTYTVKAGMTMLNYSPDDVSVNRGTYSNGMVCVSPDGGKFTEAASFAITSSAVVMEPASISAVLG